MATSDGYVQKLGNDLWLDPELMATKVCSQISSKWKTVFESHIETCIAWTIFNFLFKDFWATCYNDLLCLLTNHNAILKPEICPQFQVLTFHFSEVNMLLNEHWATWKIVQREKTGPLPELDPSVERYLHILYCCTVKTCTGCTL